jgi:hypothetical protein
MGFESIYSMARKQKVNTTSSAEAELVGPYDAVGQMIWTQNILTNQGIKVSYNILLQTNKSAIILERYGTASS